MSEPGTLILYGAGGVVGFHHVVRLFEIHAIARLVAQTPGDDAGMVFEQMGVVAVAFEVYLLVAGHLGERLGIIAHAVTLDVGFGHHIETVLVAKVVPAGIVGIVAGAHGVHVELLHHLDVLNHALHTDAVAAVGVEFVAVRTLDEHGLSVHEKLAVLDFYFAETYILHKTFEHAVAVE